MNLVSKFVRNIHKYNLNFSKRKIVNNYSMNIVNILDASQYDKCVECAAESLLSEFLVALPTDTIYGLAGLVQSDKAISEIFEVKKRTSDKPLAICVSDIDDIYLWSKVNVSRDLLCTLLPGPVTLLFERSETLNLRLNPGHGLVGIRIPDYNFIRDVVRKCGSPITLTSANISSDTSSLEISEFKPLWNNVHRIFDGGRLSISELSRQGSTIVDLSKESYYTIIRKGSAFEKTIDILHNFGLSPL